MPFFERPRRLELDYQRILNKLMREWLERLPAGTSLEDLFAILTDREKGPLAQAERIARGMVTAVATGNSISWRAAAAKSMQGRRIYDLLRREMDGPVGARMRQLVSEHARLIRTMPQDLAQDVGSQIATRQMRGERAEVIAKDIRARFPSITRSRIATLARTQVSSTATAISEARAEHLGLTAYEWLSSEDARVRPSHRKMDRVIVLWSDPPAPEALIGQRSRLGHYNAGECPNCFTGDTAVNLANGCKDIWRVPYNGQIIDFMVSGQRVSMTPNHPILAADGTWKPAYLFNEGDDFIQAVGETLLIVDENKNKRLPTFEELFGAFRVLADSRPALEFDFYGDMADGNVDHISLADFLACDRPPGLNESIRDFTLSDSDTRSAVSVGPIAHSLESSVSRLEHPFFPFENGHFRHTNDISPRTIATLNSIAEEDILNSTARASELFGESQFASTGTVGSNDLIFRQIQAIVRNRPAFESPDLSCRVRISQKSFRHFVGHVYTLQSQNGRYSVTSTNIISRNCRCDANVLVDIDQVRWPHKVHVRGSIVILTRAKFLQLTA